MRRVGILGGTFDPIHCGHLDVGRAAESALALTEVLVIPSNIPPHRPPAIASGFHRFAMVALALGGHPHWRASDVELRAGSRSFTTGTLQRFHDEGYAATELVFLIGADACADIQSWKDYPAILDRAHFGVVSRPGMTVAELSARLPALAPRMRRPSDIDACDRPAIFLVDAATADVSSTAIRQRVAAGLPLAGLLPASVQQHIEQHGLYVQPQSNHDSHLADEVRHTPTAGRLHGQG